MATKDVPLHGPSVDIVRLSSEALSNVLQSKFGCVAIIEGVESQHDFGFAQHLRPAVEDQPRFAVKLQGGVQVSVWKGDLTVFKADAIVNAANIDLQHYGGLASALSQAGGPQVQSESDDYVKNHGSLKTGDAVVTSPGLLPCKCIIHAVGPKLPRYPSKSDVSDAEPSLKKAIKSILDKVKHHHLQSVAIPAISSGLFNYPLTRCANTIVSTVKEYFSIFSPHKQQPKEIFLVNNDEPTVLEMTRACKEILGQHNPMTYSQATSTKSRDDTKTSAHSLQIGNVNLKLKKGRIEEQQTDVIVNTTSESRDLDIGAISKALLNKAGPEMQKELSKTPPSGHVFITSGYRLGCRNVFHTFCDKKEKYGAHQKLYTSVLECLQLTIQGNLKSITFPAIGTGNLGFSRSEVAEIILGAVTEFSTSQKRLEVSVVIFPDDNYTFQAFEEKIKCLKEGLSGPSFDFASKTSDDFRTSKASSPKIILNGPSEEATHEAKRWLEDLFFNSFGTVVIHNNFTMHFGNQEYQQLSRLTQKGVFIEEFFDKGRAGIMIKGTSNEEVAVAVLQVEAILCRIQEEFLKTERWGIQRLLMKDAPFWRKSSSSPQEFKDRLSLFGNNRMRIIKVEKVENPALEEVFEFKKRQLKCLTSRTMFQRIPAQFTEMVCRIGFHAEYAPPQDPAFGEGIYFAGTIVEAMEVWGEPNDAFVYFVEAEVLAGLSTPGKPGLILPPSMGGDPQTLYNSVSGGRDISVIFSGYQALPKYIITCKVS